MSTTGFRTTRSTAASAPAAVVVVPIRFYVGAGQ